eukprot:240019_1
MSALLMLFIPILCVYGQNYVGPIMIRENGVNRTRYAMSDPPGKADKVEISGTSVSVPYNVGIKIAETKNNTYGPNIWMQYYLNGKTLAYTVDLSDCGCSCVCDMYLTSMPGIGSNGQPKPGDLGNYYCDANDVNGVFCWEFDIQEANKYTTAVTAHTCDAPPHQYADDCDGGGCETNAYNVDSTAMCPDDSCRIDTRYSFRYSIHFGDTYNVVLEQGGSTLKFNACDDENYRNSMTQAMSKGMVLSSEWWGGSYNEVSWLDGMTGCQGACQGNGRYIWKDLEIYDPNIVNPFYSAPPSHTHL